MPNRRRAWLSPCWHGVKSTEAWGGKSPRPPAGLPRTGCPVSRGSEAHRRGKERKRRDGRQAEVGRVIADLRAVCYGIGKGNSES